MDYGRIVRRAWEITWRHKVLWIFGIAAALFSGGGFGGGGGNGAQYRMNDSDLNRWRGMVPFGGNWEAAVPVILAIIGVLVLLALVFAVVGIVVRYTSYGALIGMVDEVERTERTSFRSGLRRGWRHLLRVFAIDLIIGIALFFVVLVVIFLTLIGGAFAVLPAIMLAQGDSGGATVVGILWGIGVGLAVLFAIIAVSVVVSAVSTLVRELAFRARVLEGQGVFASLGAAFRLIRSRLKEVLLVWLLLLAINLALTIITIPLVVIGVVGFIGPAIAAYAITESALVTLLVVIPLVLLFILIAAFLGGIYVTFQSTVWTLAYRELRSDHLVAEAI